MGLLLQAELAKRLVAIEIPDRSERTALRVKEAEKAVPIPERVWALRNVAATSAMGGRDGQVRARGLLERAIHLKQGFVGSPQHPGTAFCIFLRLLCTLGRLLILFLH